jgi:hypothetical protein
MQPKRLCHVECGTYSLEEKNMKKLMTIATLAIAGLSVVACTAEVSSTQPRPQGSSWNQNSPRGDADRDGVSNRNDRAPNNPYRS